MSDKKKQKNCTTIFMVAPFGIGRERLLSNGFLGAYLGDVNKTDVHYDRGIYMLFKPENIPEFEDFLYEERERGANIVEDYDYEDGYVVLIYVLEEEFLGDYKYFLEGKYSKFSKKFKETFPRTIIVADEYGEREEITTQQRVFNKDESVKEYWEETLGIELGDSELWSKPDTEKGSNEYLDIGKVKIEEKDV